MNKLKDLFDILAGAVLIGLALNGYVTADTSIPTVNKTMAVITVFSVVYALFINRFTRQ